VLKDTITFLILELTGLIRFIEGLVFARDGYANNPAENERLMLPWNTPERSITGGAIFLGKDYINNLQNTLYLQKFDLRHGPNYWHQYMANVFAPPE